MSDLLAFPALDPPPEAPSAYDLIRGGMAVLNLFMSEDFDPERHDEALQAWLEDLELGVPNKLRALHYVLRSAEGLDEMLGKEIDRLQKRRKVVRGRIARLKEMVVGLAQTHKGLTGENTVDMGTLRATLYETPGRVDLDLDALPDEYGDSTWVPNKTRVKAALKRGVAVPGAKLVKGLAVRWS